MQPRVLLQMACHTCGSFPLCTKCRSHNEHGILPGNETSCAHAYKIRTQRTATTECCEWLLLTRVNLRLWRLLSGWEAACCDEHPFRAKIKVSAWTVFELSLFDKVVWTKKERITKMALLLPHTFLFNCLSRGFWPLIWVLLITKALKEEAWALK